MAMRLLSAPTLENKNIGVLLIPGKAILFYVKDNYSTIGVAIQHKDRLFYIPDYQSPQSVKRLSQKDSKVLSDMTAVAKDSARVSSPADNSNRNRSSIMDKKSSTAQLDDKGSCGRNPSTQDLKR